MKTRLESLKELRKSAQAMQHNWGELLAAGDFEGVPDSMHPLEFAYCKFLSKIDSEIREEITKQSMKDKLSK